MQRHKQRRASSCSMSRSSAFNVLFPLQSDYIYKMLQLTTFVQTNLSSNVFLGIISKCRKNTRFLSDHIYCSTFIRWCYWLWHSSLSLWFEPTGQAWKLLITWACCDLRGWMHPLCTARQITHWSIDLPVHKHSFVMLHKHNEMKNCQTDICFLPLSLDITVDMWMIFFWQERTGNLVKWVCC